MALPVLSTTNHVDREGVVIAASETTGDLSSSNLANAIIANRWRTTSLTATLDIDFGENVETGLLALRFPRDTPVPVAGTVRHQLDADGGTPGAGAAYDSAAVPVGTDPRYGYHVHLLSSAVSVRYWRVTFNLSGVLFVDVGRAWAGPVFRSTYGLAYGDTDTWVDPSLIQTGVRSSAEYVDPLSPRRLMRDGFVAVTDAERSELRNMAYDVGINSQVLFVCDPDTASTETIIGRFRVVPSLARAQPGRSILPFEILEST